MFGYVNVYKDELKVKDYNRFRGYYCGLCKAMGKRCSHITRFGLSYDMTFLAILLSALSEKPSKTKLCRCMAHPFHKRENIIYDEAVDYAADMGVLLVYLKLRDDWEDDRSVKALLGMFLYQRGVKQARKRHEQTYHYIRERLAELSRIERENCASPDEAADCFAKILECLFTPDFAQENARVLKWIGYNIGHWIYLIDAYHDIDKDWKNKSYNPFLTNFHPDAQSLEEYKKGLDLDTAMTQSLSNIASGYELLKIYKNDDILRNILYLGLKLRQDAVLRPKEENPRKAEGSLGRRGQASKES